MYAKFVESHPTNTNETVCGGSLNVTEDVLYEVDEFFGENEGLIVAEVELQNENQQFPSPDWLAKEVTSDSRYFNSNLVLKPFSKWKR